eukprot:SAG11_NODE_9_length_28972_cov_81.532539_16_plen_193_part_00
MICRVRGIDCGGDAPLPCCALPGGVQIIALTTEAEESESESSSAAPVAKRQRLVEPAAALAPERARSVHISNLPLVRPPSVRQHVLVWQVLAVIVGQRGRVTLLALTTHEGLTHAMIVRIAHSAADRRGRWRHRRYALCLSASALSIACDSSTVGASASSTSASPPPPPPRSVRPADCEVQPTAPHNAPPLQ